MDTATRDCVEEVVFFGLTRDNDGEWFCPDTPEHSKITDMFASNYVGMRYALAWEHEATTTYDELPAATLWRYKHQDSNSSSKTERRESTPPASATVSPDHNLEMDLRWLEHILERSEHPPEETHHKKHKRKSNHHSWDKSTPTQINNRRRSSSAAATAVDQLKGPKINRGKCPRHRAIVLTLYPGGTAPTHPE
ncbi:hypothetical protein DL95DRAFT_457315 [Leptodontidium sp. 2 PMI_412]|nr:hypothetical protein DL95DRAFT_457315 [Leptodontidium sp. 2 PMI_412]